MQTQPGPKKASIQDVISEVKASVEPKLWRLDVMQREDGSENYGFTWVGLKPVTAIEHFQP